VDGPFFGRTSKKEKGAVRKGIERERRGARQADVCDSGWGGCDTFGGLKGDNVHRGGKEKAKGRGRSFRSHSKEGLYRLLTIRPPSPSSPPALFAGRKASREGKGKRENRVEKENDGRVKIGITRSCLSLKKGRRHGRRAMNGGSCLPKRKKFRTKEGNERITEKGGNEISNNWKSIKMRTTRPPCSPKEDSSPRRNRAEEQCAKGKGRKQKRIKKKKTPRRKRARIKVVG